MTTPSQILSEDEYKLVRDYVLLPLLMSVADKNLSEINRSQYSIKGLYQAATNAILDDINKDLVNLRKELKKRDIVVLESKKTNSPDYALNYTVYFRGYEEEFSIMKSLVKSQLSILLGKYVSALEKRLRS